MERLLPRLEEVIATYRANREKEGSDMLALTKSIATMNTVRSHVEQLIGCGKDDGDLTRTLESLITSWENNEKVSMAKAISFGMACQETMRA